MNWAVILAGGVGSRFWPVSTPERPKQLLALTGSEPLVVASVRRLQGLIPPERTLVIAGAHLANQLRSLLPELPPDNVRVEPRAASTAPALAWATVIAAQSDPEARVLSLHADWAISNGAAFRETAAKALDIASDQDVLVTVGVPPTRPDPGFGYIVPGGELAPGARRVARFIEKPDPPTAQGLIRDGALWNTGLFAWTAHRFVQELKEHAFELRGALAALNAGDHTRFFVEVTAASVDTAVLERSERVAVVTAAFDWDDVGTWAALPRVHPTDASGNVVRGRVATLNTSGCIVWNEGDAVVLAGVSDLVVVSANGVTLVTTRDQAAHLKSILQRLPPDLQSRA